MYHRSTFLTFNLLFIVFLVSYQFELLVDISSLQIVLNVNNLYAHICWGKNRHAPNIIHDEREIVCFTGCLHVCDYVYKEA